MNKEEQNLNNTENPKLGISDVIESLPTEDFFLKHRDVQRRV